jgi:hypothetical protein
MVAISFYRGSMLDGRTLIADITAAQVEYWLAL